MFFWNSDNQYVRIDYISDSEFAEEVNASMVGFTTSIVHTTEKLGGYRHPILDHFATLCDDSWYQVLKMSRPSSDEEMAILDEILHDKNTLYGYPDGNTITIVQMSNFTEGCGNLESLGVTLNTSQKMFKRLKTFNRRFRAFTSVERPVRVMLIEDTKHCSYKNFVSAEDAEKLLDGAFIISPSIVAQCMKSFDYNTTVFDSSVAFTTDEFNRNHEIGDFYRKSKIFNARVFGDIEVINEGDPEEYAKHTGAIKGQAYLDHSGACEHFGVDVIAPYSAFKNEVNLTGTGFFLIEPQGAKLGQMYSDGQTIANMPALYRWRNVKSDLAKYYQVQFAKLVNNQMLEQWSDMSFAMFDSDRPKMFDNEDIAALNAWNVRAWLLHGGKLSDSPWLFSQMAKNFLASMRPDDERKMRFPVPCAVRALVITESLLRAIKGISVDGDEFFHVEPGTARWDVDLSVLVVNDWDYIEMYPSHGGCDLDDFFQVYWRTLNGQKVIIVLRSPNDWGEYSVFKYHEGDWCSKTTYGDQSLAFPEIPSDERLWPTRLSEALAAGEVTYTGLPEVESVFLGENYNADYVRAAVECSAQSAASVGINVNARQLWSATMGAHRPVQVCSMEDAIDAGVQGGSEEQCQAVIEEGNKIIEELIESGHKIEAYLWLSKHADFHNGETPPLHYGNFSYLNKVRTAGADWFRNSAEEYAKNIPANADYSQIIALGSVFLSEATNVVKQYRRALRDRNLTHGDDINFSSLADELVRLIESKSVGQHRHAFVMSLYAACVTIPLASGAINDQIVMQPKIFGFLMDAMIEYGLLGKLGVDSSGNLYRHYKTEWCEHCDETGRNIMFDNAIDYQKNYFGITNNNEATA